ncbi:MAG: hypothetical protein AB1714_24615 [Acidobacteriota bacterium]
MRRRRHSVLSAAVLSGVRTVFFHAHAYGDVYDYDDGNELGQDPSALVVVIPSAGEVPRWG